MSLTSSVPIEIFVNGEAHRVASGASVLQLLGQLNIDPARVAIELDRRILKQPLWGDTRLAQGSRLEIVQFVGGG